MAAFNEFSEITFNDGASPPINAANLNALEGVVNLTDKELARSQSFKLREYLEYFRKRNTKDIDIYDDDQTSYTNGNPTNATLSNESGYSGEGLINSQALKATIDIAGAGYIDESIVLGNALNLTQFLDGSVSSTDDIIILLFKLSDQLAYSGGSIYLNIGNGGIGNTYEYDFDVDSWGFDTGWNVAWIPKSSFFIWSGAPNWNNIDFIQVQFDFNAGYQNEYVIINLLQMIRHDPNASDYPNPFQKYMGSVSDWINTFDQNYPIWTILFDNNIKNQKLGMIKLNPANFETPFTPDNYKNGMKIYDDINCFISKFEWICKEDHELPGVCWYVDSTHYAEVYITSSDLYLSVANGGAAVNTTWSFNDNLNRDEKIVILFEKDGDTLRAISFKGNEIMGACEYESTFSSSGDLFLGVSSDNSFGILTDFAISNSLNQLHLADENMPIAIKKTSNETVNSSTTLQDDNDLFCRLRPNQLYRIELFLMVASTSNDRDLKVAWSLTNCEQVTTRNVIGPDVSCTAAYSTSVKISNFDLTASAVYGITSDTSRTSNIQESFLIKSGESGGFIQLQWAQYSSGAASVTLRSNCYMIVTPVKADK